MLYPELHTNPSPLPPCTDPVGSMVKGNKYTDMAGSPFPISYPILTPWDPWLKGINVTDMAVHRPELWMP